MHNINGNNATLDLISFCLVQFRRTVILLYVLIVLLLHLFLILLATIINTTEQFYFLNFNV